MVTTADVTDRNGAVDMVSYYCDNTDNLSHVKKLLADGGYTGQNFADEIKKISGHYQKFCVKAKPNRQKDGLQGQA